MIATEERRDAPGLPAMVEPRRNRPPETLREGVERILSQLDQYTDISALSELHAQARALAEYLREHDGHGCALRVAQLRIEKRIGEVLAESVRPGNPQLSRDPTIGRLPEGITRDQSSRWQKLAAIPEKTFEDYLAGAQKPSLNGALRHALQAAGADETGETAVCCGPRELELLVQRGVKFRTLYADPPWAYTNQATRGATGNHYRTMPTPEIAALPIEKLAANVAQLHLWATDRFLEDAIEVLRAWGFERKSMLIWEKRQLGLGNYYRMTHEYLLLGTRGGAQFPDDQRNHRSVMRADRDVHSRKPEQFRQLVEQVSQAPRLELFARRPVENWTVWGNEIEQDRFHEGVQETLDNLDEETG